MRLNKNYVSGAAAFLFFVGIAIQSFDVAQARKYGYNQADCPALVKQAIDTVSSECSKAGRNKLCYGNSTIQAEFQPGAGNVTFQSPGDTVDVSQIKQFTLGGMDTTANTWGVAEMKIKADLPNTDPSQAVTMILFGNVQLSDATADANQSVLTQTPGAVARQNQYATATANAINQQAIHQAATATKIAALEQTATARAQTPTPTGTIPALKGTQAAATATKLAAYVNTATAAAKPQTPVPTSVSGPYSGLQAFYFQSSDTAPCDQAPHDGILIQSPQGKQRVTLVIDGATISLGSTVYITAQPSKFLTVNTLEGSAQVTVGGQTQTATPRMAVQVPLDTNLRASGAPLPPQFYTSDAIRALPIVALPTVITPAPGLPPGVIHTTWTFSVGATFQDFGTGVCAGSDTSTGPTESYNTDIWQDNAGGTMWIADAWPWPQATSITLTKSANDTYQGSTTDGTGVTESISLHFTDSTHMTGQITISISDTLGTCGFSVSIAATQIGGPS